MNVSSVRVQIVEGQSQTCSFIEAVSFRLSVTHDTTSIRDGVSLDGSHALVTGASSGIGRCIAVELAAAGAAVTIADVDSQPSDDGPPTHKVIERDGGRARYSNINVTDHDAVQSMVADAEEDFGPVEILVNNAGINRLGSVEELSVEEWDEVFSVNLRGAYSVTQAALSSLRLNDGRLVNIASTAGINGAPDYAAYGPSKAGLINLTRQLAVDYSPEIRVNAVAPGVIDTGIAKQELEDPERAARKREATLLSRFGTEQDVANCVLFLVSDAATFVTGEVLVVDGGLNA